MFFVCLCVGVFWRATIISNLIETFKIELIFENCMSYPVNFANLSTCTDLIVWKSCNIYIYFTSVIFSKTTNSVGGYPTLFLHKSSFDTVVTFVPDLGISSHSKENYC